MQPPRWKQLIHFLLHLRWHYQLFILSGPYLLGGVMSEQLEPAFWFQFFNVQLLLFGGATVYNSFWDADEGPIGGLQHPPPLQPWMWWASWAFQLAGFVWAYSLGPMFAVFYALSMLFFWLYSTPIYRWKGRPLLSLAAIGVSSGLCSGVMGYIAAGGSPSSPTIWMAAIGATAILLSLYPVSQLYQIDEDRTRGDVTFAAAYGRHGVMHFYVFSYTAGLALLAMALELSISYAGWTLAGLGSITGGIVYYMLSRLGDLAAAYTTIMRLKYGASMAFVCFLLILLFLRY